jgi:serpin B
LGAFPGGIKAADVTVNKLQGPVYGETSDSAEAAASGANDFAFRLSAALLEDSGGDNFVCSPYCVWLPLAALLNATDAQHKDALKSAIGAAGISEADINQAASRMLYDLTNQGQNENGEEFTNPLKIANVIFVGKNVTLKMSFAQTFMDYYRGTAMNVDFSSNEAVDSVNKWASDNTDGLITDIVQKFSSDTVAAVANAIYFSDRWTWEFNPDETKEDVFHAPDGDIKAFFMVREGNSQSYFEDDKIQATLLRFKTGGGMYVILPKDGDASGLLASMTNSRLSEIETNSVDATGKLLLPRFSIESDVMPLNDSLISLGVPLFDEKEAPLTGGLLEEDIPVWISGALQKALIKVDEKGTTAAAVTVMMAAGSAMPLPTEPFEMKCDKPFAFILFGNTYDGGSQVLFTGVVNKP